MTLRASKENATRALDDLQDLERLVSRLSSPPRLEANLEPIKRVAAFLVAARSKLPTEAAFEADAKRRRKAS